MSVKIPYQSPMSAMDSNRHQRHSKSSSSSSNYTTLLTPTREKLYFGATDTIYDESYTQYSDQQGRKDGVEDGMDSETRLDAEWGLRLERVLNSTPRAVPALMDDSPTIPALDDDVLLDDSPLLPPLQPLLSDENLPPLLPSAVDLNDPFMALRPSISRQPVTPPKAFKQLRPATPRRTSGKKQQTHQQNPIAVRLSFDDVSKENSTVNPDSMPLGSVHRPSAPSIKSLARSNSRSSINTSNFGPIIPGRNSSRPKPPSIKLRSTSLKAPSPKPAVPSLPVTIARASTPTYTLPESPLSFNKLLPLAPIRRPSEDSIESALDPQSFLPKDTTTTKGGEISSLITVIDTYVSHQFYNNRFAASSTATLGFNHQYHYKTIREIRSAPELRRTNQLEFETEMLEWRKIFSSSSSTSPSTGTVPSKPPTAASRFSGSIRSRLYSVQSLGRRNTTSSKMSRTHSDDYVPPGQNLTIGMNNKGRKSVLSSEVFTPPSSSRLNDFGGIEHIANPITSSSRKGKDKEMIIPSYNSPLVPHQNTIMSPAPVSIKTRNVSPDLVKDVRDECKLEDILREEALAAIKEAETWDWPQVPDRRRMIKFLGEEHEIPMDSNWTSPVQTNAQASSSGLYSIETSPENDKEGSPSAPSIYSRITAHDLFYGRPPKPSHEIARVLARDIPSNSLGLSNSISSSSMETTPSTAESMIFTPSPSLLLNIPNSETSASPRTPTFNTMVELENDVTPKAPVREGLGASIELPSPSQPRRQVKRVEEEDADEVNEMGKQRFDSVRHVKSERRNVRFNDQALTVVEGVEGNEKKKKWYKSIKSPHIPF